jgi:hypothetical protein
MKEIKKMEKDKIIQFEPKPTRKTEEILISEVTSPKKMQD